MKILHVLSTPRAEGTPNLVLDWLATNQHEQEVFVLNSQPADLTNCLRSAAKWYAEENYFGRGRRKFTDIAAGIRRVCKHRRPDSLLCWPTGFSNWVCTGARLAGVRRLLVHCGNPPIRGMKADWMSRYGMWPLLLAGADCVCCSNYVRDLYRSIPGVPAGLFRTVYNSTRAGEIADRVDAIRLQEGRREGRAVTIMVATLEMHKDHATLLRAVPAILAKRSDFRLLLAGEGSMRAVLEELCQSLGVGDVVRFLGARNDVADWLARSDLFVLSTTAQEGLGSVLLEALAAGLPVVASDCPACREILQGGRYGVLVPPNDPPALARAIVGELAKPRDPGAGIEYARGFTPERMMKHYLSPHHLTRQ